MHQTAFLAQTLALWSGSRHKDEKKCPQTDAMSSVPDNDPKRCVDCAPHPGNASAVAHFRELSKCAALSHHCVNV